jgi:hypothetical protein
MMKGPYPGDSMMVAFAGLFAARIVWVAVVGPERSRVRPTRRQYILSAVIALSPLLVVLVHRHGPEIKRAYYRNVFGFAASP